MSELPAQYADLAADLAAEVAAYDAARIYGGGPIVMTIHFPEGEPAGHPVTECAARGCE